eukprot:scaffold238220_cov23-Tisochrysis_lutea.AAC.1
MHLFCNHRLALKHAYACWKARLPCPTGWIPAPGLVVRQVYLSHMRLCTSPESQACTLIRTCVLKACLPGPNIDHTEPAALRVGRKCTGATP